MSEFMFKFFLSSVNTFISHKMCFLPISTQRYNKHCSSNEWVGKCIYRFALLLLLAVWVFFNIQEYFTFSVHRSNNMNVSCGRNNAVRLEFPQPFWSESVSERESRGLLRRDPWTVSTAWAVMSKCACFEIKARAPCSHVCTFCSCPLLVSELLAQL
jgi:hypothetical protein